MPSIAYAGNYDPCDSKYLSAIVNDCSPHTVDTDTDTQLDHAWGAGADIELWTNGNPKGLLTGVHGEYRWDGNNNGRHSGFLVARINLWQKIKNFLNKD